MAEQEGIKDRLILAGLSENEINRELELMEQKFPKNAETFLKIISGKDYLIHLMSCHAKNLWDTIQDIGRRHGNIICTIL